MAQLQIGLSLQHLMLPFIACRTPSPHPTRKETIFYSKRFLNEERSPTLGDKQLDILLLLVRFLSSRCPALRA